MIRGNHTGDFLIDKYFVRALISYQGHQFKISDDSLSVMHEQFELKPLLEKACSVDLVGQYGYSKYEKHKDLFELHYCSNYLTNMEFGRVSRKYLAKSMDARIQIRVRFIILGSPDESTVTCLKTGAVASVSIRIRQEEFESVAAAPGARRLYEALRRRRARRGVAVVVGGCKKDRGRHVTEMAKKFALGCVILRNELPQPQTTSFNHLCAVLYKFVTTRWLWRSASVPPVPPLTVSGCLLGIISTI